jgi:hypothetical protein
MDDLEFRASQMGMIHALQVAIRAIVSTHPDPTALVREFEREHLESISILLGSHLPDAALEAYEGCLRGCAPNVEDWLDRQS